MNILLPASLLLVALLPTGAWAAPDAQALQAAWQEASGPLEQVGRFAVELDDGDFDDLARGGVARHRLKLDGADRAIGAIWTEHTQDELWVAILDDTCFTLADGLTERHLPSSEPLRKVLFQHVAVPWPFLDRQWILDIRSNDRLFAASHGAAWERSWTLAEGQQELAKQVPGADMPVQGAVWTPENDGGWLVLEAAGGNLLVYHARVDIGGVVPDGAFTAWTLASLEKLLTTVVGRADQVTDHYDGGHDPILRPDGQPIPGW